MLAVFLQVLPFFAIIGLGWGAGRRGFFPEEATNWLTRFVFFFALSAMLFRASANMPLGDVLDGRVVAAYLVSSTLIYLVALFVALKRGESLAASAFEAHCAIIGNIGFLGIPMLAEVMGPRALPVIMQMMAIDLLVYTSVLVILVSASRGGKVGLAALGPTLRGVIANPMMMAIVLGFLWSGFDLPIPRPMDEFLTILGAAATPGALFAIGASLASRRLARPAIAGWISFAKLVLHPAAVALAAYLLAVNASAAAVLVAAAALPVAGNIFMQAVHYGVAPQRVSAAILISTAASAITVSLILSEVLTW